MFGSLNLGPGDGCAILPPIMMDFLTWQVVLRAALVSNRSHLPSRIATISPGLRHIGMPEEVGILLPSNAGPKALVDALVGQIGRLEDAALGLFLGGPFLNVGLEGARIAAAGISWITNLPSVVQQDPSFSEELADVGLGFERELEGLAGFRAQGFRIAVVVADAPGASLAAELQPEAMIVLPRVADFAAGFPSLRQRGAAAQAVAEAAAGAGWSGLRIGLGEAGEVDHERLWPDSLDGLLCRPVVEPLDMS